MRDAVKDRSYRATPLGLEVARYYRWKKDEWGATVETMRDYDAILRNLALYFANLELSDFAPPVGTERIREAWNHRYGDQRPAPARRSEASTSTSSSGLYVTRLARQPRPSACSSEDA
jgi:hypothetical protein